MVEVLGVGLSLHKVIVILGQMIVNRLDEAGRVIRVLSARGRSPSAAGGTGVRCTHDPGTFVRVRVLRRCCDRGTGRAPGGKSDGGR